MSLETKMKKRVDQMNANLDEIVKNPYKKKERFPFWAKILVPVGATVMSAALILGITIPLLNSRSVPGRLTTPVVKKISKECFYTMSGTTYKSYMEFSKKFVSLMMKENNSTNEQSLGISIPDAYLCLAIVGIISDEKCLNDVLNFYELKSEEELKVAVKEVIATLCTLYRNNENELVGGYNLNSIWINPNLTVLLEQKDKQLYKDLEEIFDASIYMAALTNKTANDYLKDNGLKNMPTPEIELDEKNEDALNVMSVYYCLDYFKDIEKDRFISEYRGGEHKLKYTYDGLVKNVNYIEKTSISSVYENENFYGSYFSFNNLNMAFFLPNEVDVMPSAILDDVLSENYNIKTFKGINQYTEEEYETQSLGVTISAPYFKLDNKSELDRKTLNDYFPNLTSEGAASRIAKSRNGNPMFLDYLKQFSVMKFNYDGFYSCSVTIAGVKTESAILTDGEFKLTLDHPYIFETRKLITVDGNHSEPKFVPLVVGEIVNPDYQE